MNEKAVRSRKDDYGDGIRSYIYIFYISTSLLINHNCIIFSFR